MAGAATVYRPALSSLDSCQGDVGGRAGANGVAAPAEIPDVDDDMFEIAPDDLLGPATPAAHGKLHGGQEEEEDEEAWRVRVVVRDLVVRVQETSLSCKGLTLVALRHPDPQHVEIPSISRNAAPAGASPHVQPGRGEGQGRARMRRHVMLHFARLAVQHEDAACIGHTKMLDPQTHTDYAYSHPGSSTPQGATYAKSADLRFACSRAASWCPLALCVYCVWRAV